MALYGEREPAMNDHVVNIQIDIRGTVPWRVAASLFEGATKLTPEDGQLAFTIDGDVDQPVRLASSGREP